MFAAAGEPFKGDANKKADGFRDGAPRSMSSRCHNTPLSYKRKLESASHRLEFFHSVILERKIAADERSH